MSDCKSFLRLMLRHPAVRRGFLTDFWLFLWRSIAILFAFGIGLAYPTLPDFPWLMEKIMAGLLFAWWLWRLLLTVAGGYWEFRFRRASAWPYACVQSEPMSRYLRVMLIILAILLASVCLSIAEGQPLKAQHLLEESQALLPQTSQHRFVAVDPAWRKTINFLRVQPDAFVGVEKPSSEEKKSLYKEIRYFVGSADKLNDAVKILTYYPSGKLYREIDKLPEEQFTAHFFADGSFADFTHWRRRISLFGDVIAGVAIDPNTGKDNHFTEGTGSLTTYDDVHHSSKTEWYLYGRAFMEESSNKSHRTKIRLNAGDDSLIILETEERLILVSENESWARKAGQNPLVHIVGNQEKEEIPRIPTDGRYDPRGRIDGYNPERERILKKWKTIYEKRRSSFLNHFTNVLTATGQSWQSLNIEFIRDDAPWPQPKTQP